MMSEPEIKEQVRDWIRERAADRLDGELTDDTPLLDTGLLSSLDVTELIVFVEYLRGEEVDLDAIEPGLLKNIDTLYQGFFGNAAQP